MEYKQYVKPLIQYLKPLLEKDNIKDEYVADLVANLKKEISVMKSPLFRLKRPKNQMVTFGRFYYYLYELYKTSINSILSYSYRSASFEVFGNGDKRKAFVNGTRVLKKYRGIIGRRASSHYLKTNASNEYDNASKIYFVPRKNVDILEIKREIDSFALYDDMNIKHLRHDFEVFSKIAKSMRFRDADVANNTVRTGAAYLQEEMLEGMHRPLESERQRKRFSDAKAEYKEYEDELQKAIAEQQETLDKLRAEAITTMTDKTAQQRLNRMIKAQNRLLDLKQKLRDWKEHSKKALQEDLKEIKRDRARSFYGLGGR